MKNCWKFQVLTIKAIRLLVLKKSSGAPRWISRLGILLKTPDFSSDYYLRIMRLNPKSGSVLNAEGPLKILFLALSLPLPPNPHVLVCFHSKKKKKKNQVCWKPPFPMILNKSIIVASLSSSLDTKDANKCPKMYIPEVTRINS